MAHNLKKAFDTVDHSILLKKMGKYDIKRIEMSWFQSYLKFGSQLCKVHGTNSETQNIEIGVPQGTCRGPFLFLQISYILSGKRNCLVISIHTFEPPSHIRATSSQQESPSYDVEFDITPLPNFIQIIYEKLKKIKC